jgi:hypothetical protein
VCAEAGDPGEGGTFTPLSGTILEGMRMDIATLWLVVEHFVEGQAAVETADEARIHRHTPAPVGEAQVAPPRGPGDRLNEHSE